MILVGLELPVAVCATVLHPGLACDVSSRRPA